MWLAGGGIKPGLTYGKTDELGFNVVENPVHVHDLQATILHLLGLDHERLTFRYAGRDFRLTESTASRQGNPGVASGGRMRAFSRKRDCLTFEDSKVRQ